MQVFETGFLPFSLPDAATWFYLSLVLVIALFLRFSRPLSLRNWDILTLFILVPALLFLREAQESHRKLGIEEEAKTLAAGAHAVANTAARVGSAGAGGSLDPTTPSGDPIGRATASADHTLFLAYLFLLVGSGYFLLRCFIDIALVRRPVLQPNLNAGGLTWLCAALAIVLAAKTILPQEEPANEPQSRSLMLEKATAVAAEAAKQVNPPDTPQEEDDLRPLVQKSMALGCHALVLIGLIILGIREFQSYASGIAMAGLYLLLPYTAYAVQEIHHVFPAAVLIIAFVSHRRPLIAGFALGAAATTVYFPILLLPLWIGYYRRAGAGRFLLAFLIIPLSAVYYMLFNQTLVAAWESATSLPDWQAWILWRPTSESIWRGLDSAFYYRVPLFVFYLILVTLSAFWPSPKNFGHLIAWTTALILGVQFWYADHGGTFVLWYLPFLLLMICRPNLAERVPKAIDNDSDWLHRCVRWVWRGAKVERREPARVG